MKTTSLKLSKWLYEHGVKANTKYRWSQWYWGVLTFGKPAELFKGEYRVIETSCFIDDTEYPAFSCEELLEMLPKYIPKYGFMEIWMPSNEWRIEYKSDVKILTSHKNIPEALGLMVKYLIEQGYVYDKEKRWLIR